MYVRGKFNDNKKELYHPAPLVILSKRKYDPARVVDPPSRDVGNSEGNNAISSHGRGLAWDVVSLVPNKGVCMANNECNEHLLTRI